MFELIDGAMIESVVKCVTMSQEIGPKFFETSKAMSK